MKNYLTAGIGFRRLFRLARKNKVSAHPKYILRFLFLAQSGLWTELFSWFEQRRYGIKIASTPVPDDPIFIIGHWRTGTTLLHQLLNLDPNLAAPTLFQVAEPEGFICSYRYYLPVFATFVADNRPMDNVRIGMNEPQEDEYAMYRITGFSPIERLVFPKDRNYFILDNECFLPADEKEKEEWGGKLHSYFRKLHFFHGKTIVSKNPFNSFRIKELATLFPNARFIHIVRHPYEVVPSTIHMWKIVHAQNRLNRKGADPELENVAMGLEKLLTRIEMDKALIPCENFYEMRFEELEADPVGECRKIYERFRMPFDEGLSQKIHSFSGSLKNYRKNEFRVEDHEKEMIRKHLDKHMQKFKYK